MSAGREPWEESEAPSSPDLLLAVIRALVLAYVDQPQGLTGGQAARLATAFDLLDGQLSAGKALPAAWRNARPPEPPRGTQDLSLPPFPGDAEGPPASERRGPLL